MPRLVMPPFNSASTPTIDFAMVRAELNDHVARSMASFVHVPNAPDASYPDKA